MAKYSSTKVKDKTGAFKILTPELEKERHELYDLSLQAGTMKLNKEKYTKAEADFFAIKVKDKYDAFMKKLSSCPTAIEKPSGQNLPTKNKLNIR